MGGLPVQSGDRRMPQRKWRVDSIDYNGMVTSSPLFLCVYEFPSAFRSFFTLHINWPDVWILYMAHGIDLRKPRCGSPNAGRITHVPATV